MGLHLHRARPANDEAGVARFYGGLVQSKHISSTIMLNVVMLCLVRPVWKFIGYRLALVTYKRGVTGGCEGMGLGWLPRASAGVVRLTKGQG